MKFFTQLRYIYDPESLRREWVSERLSLITNGESILDAGAGECQYKKYASHLEYKSQDFGQYDSKNGADGLHPNDWEYAKLDYVCDINNIPVADNSFDHVLCTEVFEHIPEPETALKELVRVTRPGGTIIWSSPFCSQTHFAPYHFYDGFNTYLLEYWANKYNLKIKEVNFNGNFYSVIALENARAIKMALKDINILVLLSSPLLATASVLLALISLLGFANKTSQQLRFGTMVIFEKI